MWECKAKHQSVSQWLSLDRLKTWRCRVRKTEVSDQPGVVSVEVIKMTMIGENGREHTIEHQVIRNQNKDVHGFSELFARK